ncbi:uncharacterized protein LOC124203111 [Daphnia pulex]|uniref:uncharacterized protein LOC124203111 n=1 Tax=Daphnia pulex TaxID=6669 RepID=UPI001EDCC51E|nr:uncharacterized protein LOC124203111 [Daphnia pulex]
MKWSNPIKQAHRHNLCLLKKNYFCCRPNENHFVAHPRIRKRPTPPTRSTRFSVYVRVVAVRCGRGTLLQPMSSWCLVKDLSASSSTGCSLVVVLCTKIASLHC